MKILLPVDGSDAALEAVRHALRLRQEGLDASFLLATVQDPTYLYELLLAPDADVLERLSGTAGAHALAAAEALCNAAGAPFTREIGVGAPVATLLAMARQQGCDAIILGARGLGPLRGALLGSVSQGVLQGTHLPVTVVRQAAGLSDPGLAPPVAPQPPG
jgi:nucleotide-binding universal stress UspA family protein